MFYNTICCILSQHLGRMDASFSLTNSTHGQEFYTKGYEHNGLKVFVKNTRIPSNQDKINTFYDLSRIENDEYIQYLESINYQAVIDYLYRPYIE